MKTENKKLKRAAALLLLMLGLCLMGNVSLFGQIKVACIGDSITAGYGLSNPAVESYPAQLQAMLGSGYTVINYGVSGTTLLKKADNPYWNTGAYNESTAWLPNIVIIMLGTNDSKPYNWIYKAEYVPDHTEMINHYKQLSTGPRVYVATCATVFGVDGSGQWGITNAVVTGEVVPLQKQTASQTGCSVIDINAATASLEAYFPDFIHPDVTGCKIIAQTVYNALSGSILPTTTATRTSTRTATIAPTITATSVTRTATRSATSTATRTSTTITRTATSTRTSTSITRTATITATAITRTATITATTITRTATATATSSSTGCTCDAGCSTRIVIAPNFAKDGSGAFCFEASSLGSYINSWNLVSLKVNGVDLTNKWVSAASLPALIDGKYYVYYNSAVTYGHFEANN